MDLPRASVVNDSGKADDGQPIPFSPGPSELRVRGQIAKRRWRIDGCALPGGDEAPNGMALA